MAKLESLIVDLQANTAKLQEGLDDANKRLKGFGENFKKMAGIASGVAAFATLGNAALEAGKAVAEFAARGIDSLDRLGKQAGQLGTSSEEFSRLAFAFQLTGVEGEAFSKFMGQLGKNLSAAAAGSKEQAALFSALGVSAVDAAGRVRDTSTVMKELAGAFASMNDGPAKAAIAVELFGKGGEAMLDTLNKGSAGLAAAGLEAEKYGAVVGGPAAAAAGAFNDMMAKLKAIADALAMSLGAELLPTLNQLLASILKSDGAMQGLVSTAATIGEWFRVIIAGADIAADVFVGLADVVSRTASATRAFLSASDLFEGWDAAEKHLGGIAKAWDDMRVKSAATALSWVQLPNVAPPSPPAAGPTKSAEAVLRATKAAGDAAKKALEDQKKAADEVAKAMADLAKTAGEYEKKVALFGNTDPLAELEYRLDQGDLAESLSKVGDQAAAMRDRILESARALKALNAAKLDAQLSFEQERGAAQTSAELAARRQQFAQASASPGERAAMATAGFASFDAALVALANQTQENARLLAEAERFKADGQLESAHASLLAADEAKRAAERAAEAADAFQQIGDAAHARSQALKAAVSADSWSDAMKSLKDDFKAALGKMPNFGDELATWAERMGKLVYAKGMQLLGAVGDLVDSIVEGAKAGGVWGAIIAAFMEVAKKAESAVAFLDTAMQFIEKVASMINPLVEPIFAALQGVLEIVADVVEPIFAALQPFFNAISQLIEDISPILFAIGDLFAALSPIIEFIGMFIGRVFEFLKPLWDIIGGVIKAVATVILGVLIVLNELSAAFGDKKAAAEAKRMRKLVDSMWQDEDAAKSNFAPRGDITATGDVTATGKVTATGTVEMKSFDISKYVGGGGAVDVIDIFGDGWGYAAGSVAGAEAARAFVEQAKLLNGASVDEAAAAGQAAYDDFLALGGAAEDAAKSLTKMSSSLTNVPEGFRYAAAAFDAQGYGSDSVFGGGPEAVTNVTLKIDAEKLADIMHRTVRRRSFRRDGWGEP